MSSDSIELRRQILDLVEEFAKKQFEQQKFSPGNSTVPPSGKVLGSNEIRFMVDAALDGWLTTGRYNAEFENRLGSFLGVEHVLTVNSGSSANLTAFAALTSPKLKDKRLIAGDEVITVAASFPTTVNPIVLYGLIPVFIDVTIPTYNIDAGQIEAAITSRTRAIMIAHTLGNPFDLEEVTRIAQKHNLYLIEDCCDALGSRYNNRLVGTFGDMATLSFYPAHHITMGEGGAVFTKNAFLNKIALSIRDWGRDCYCEPGTDNSCGRRFKWKLGELPQGYDHKYTYSHLGYNLKITDMQAAVALAQMDRVDDFIAARKNNFSILHRGLASLQDILILPEATRNSDPSWFGFPITIRDGVKKSRQELQTFLDEKKIGSRLLFAGNLIRQPYFSGLNYRVHGELKNTDIVMNNTFWVGLYPGLSVDHLAYTIETITKFFKS